MYKGEAPTRGQLALKILGYCTAAVYRFELGATASAGPFGCRWAPRDATRFEWSETKRLAAPDARRLDFLDGCQLFDGRLICTAPSPRSAEEVSAMLARGGSRTDWAAVRAMTENELEASIAADPDDIHEPIDWTLAVEGMPPRKRDIHIRIDEDVLDWFRQARRGYQTRINNLLQALMESRKRVPR